MSFSFSTLAYPFELAFSFKQNIGSRVWYYVISLGGIYMQTSNVNIKIKLVTSVFSHESIENYVNKLNNFLLCRVKLNE